MAESEEERTDCLRCSCQQRDQDCPRCILHYKLRAKYLKRIISCGEAPAPK
jgi:hypothetical protein